MNQETMQEIKEIDLGKYDFKDSEDLVTKLPKGLSRGLVEEISRIKKEPEWMKELRLKAYDQFISKPLPTWGPDLSELKFDEMTYFIRPDAKNVRKWDEVPKEIKDTFDKLGIPEAEQKYLAGSVAQYESESIYHNIKKQWEDKGVIFCDMDTAVQKYPELVRKYFMRAVPITDNKFAALHAAVWSGGSFTYVPAGVKIDQPLQTYFRMNAANEGQFEHTIVIADEGSKVHYMEGCTAPKYSSHSLHSAVVEIYVKKNAEARYTTVQNWSKNVFNLNTKRAIVEENGKMEWIGGSLGCITGDTVVYSNPHGPIRMSEIREGDKVYSLDLNDLKLKKAIVKAKIFSGIKDVYKLTTERGREIKATDNHPFLVLRNSKMLSWMPLVGIRQGDFISIINSLPDEGKSYILPKIEKGGRNVIECPLETNEDLMWLFGVYLGDGYISKEAKNKHSKEKIPRRTYFAVPETDKIREKLKQKLNDIFKAKITKKGICITINSVMLCELIIKLGFSGLAHTKRIPSWIYSLPISQKLAFIEGYLDSDGYVRKKFGIRKNKQYAATFTSCNKELLGDLKTLMI